MGKAQVHHQCQPCVQFEQLMDRWEREELTDEELRFVFDHLGSCPLGQHSFESVEQECGLPAGSLRHWKWGDPVVRPSAQAATDKKRAQFEARRGTPSKRQWKVLPFSQRMDMERALADIRSELKPQRDDSGRKPS